MDGGRCEPGKRFRLAMRMLIFFWGGGHTCRCLSLIIEKPSHINVSIVVGNMKGTHSLRPSAMTSPVRISIRVHL